ncbi:hypothetical protein C3K47_09200 [Solitalea longa]|uniref:Uncharacterized protein n=1 Tax=Solitalea longa TaxID=2079460 RepID=A0A2S5A2N4_9SPHI|nr:hypothetical protein [Solitalea longa]POY36542.1 hypothetical protein C3K47_09200 [Solitalea longa]
MKKQFCLLLLLTLNALCTNAQSFSQFLNNPSIKLTYLGIDFTETRLIGDPKTYSWELKDKHFGGINEVVVKESGNYTIASAFRRKELVNNLSFVTEHNKLIDAEKIISYDVRDTMRLSRDHIQRIIDSYNFGNEKGIGLMFVMESMCKTTATGSFYVVLFDMESKKRILTQRMVGDAGGFGFRNYWARTVYEIINEIEMHTYTTWQNRNPEIGK